jgi:hypothetical protein
VEEDTYKGESPGKKYARLQFWLRVSNMLGQKRFVGSKHLVLASREGGDVSVLRGLGVPAKNIIAVDHNRQAAFEAQEKFPEVEVIVADVADVAKEYKRQFASTFLDFCAPVREELLEKVVEVMTWGLGNDSALGAAFLNGREKGQMIEVLKKEKERFNTALSRMADLPDESLLQTYAPEDAPDWPEPKKRAYLERIRKDLIEHMSDSEAPLTRATYVDYELIRRGTPRRCAPVAVSFMSYVSATKDSKGVPMFIYLGKVVRGLPGTAPHKFSRALAKEKWGGGSPSVMSFELDDAGLRDMVLRGFEGLDEEQVKARWDRMPFHLLLNVPKAKISAWRAHKTMGTYDR